MSSNNSQHTECAPIHYDDVNSMHIAVNQIRWKWRKWLIMIWVLMNLCWKFFLWWNLYQLTSTNYTSINWKL